jgi:hypothetical protein
MINVYKIVVGKPGGRHHMGYLGVDERIMLKWILNK